MSFLSGSEVLGGRNVSIQVSCTKCNRTYKVRDELAGKKAKCACGEMLSIPTPVVEPLPPQDPLANLADESFDPFAGIDGVGEGSSPLQPLAKPRKRKSMKKGINPRLFVTLFVGLGGCALVGGLIFLVVVLARNIGLVAEPRWKTPEEVYAAWDTAPERGDWRLYFETQCPKWQDRLVENAAGTAMMGASDCPALAEVCSDYGLEPIDLESLKGDAGALEEIGSRVESMVQSMYPSEKVSLFAEVVAVLTDSSKLPKRVPRSISRAVFSWELKKKPSKYKKRLVDVQINGETATGSVEYVDANGEVTSKSSTPKKFVLVDGEWRVGEPDNRVELARRKPSYDNLKKVGIAMHKYHGDHRRLPAKAILDPQGKPLLSWRVQLLPYLGYNELYRQFHLDEPWDSPNNKALIERMPEVYRNPNYGIPPGKATFLAVVGPGTIFEGDEGISLSDILSGDGMTNTIILVEVAADKAVVWTKPEDWQYDPEHPLAGLGVAKGGDFVGLISDACPKLFNAEKDLELWRNMLTYNGGEKVEWF